MPKTLPEDTRKCLFCQQQGDGETDGPGRLVYSSGKIKLTIIYILIIQGLHDCMCDVKHDLFFADC